MKQNSVKKSANVRVRHNDIEKSVYRPNNPESLSDFHAQWGNSVDRYVLVYTMTGYHDYLDEDNKPALFDLYDPHKNAEDRSEAYAKVVVVNNGNPKYSIRRDSSGKLLDPLGLFSEKNHSKNRHHTQIREWEWKEVNKKTFEHYLRYLETKNRSHFLNAEREAF